MPAKIVITGGPGSGKTESLARLKDIPRYRKFVFLSELARKLLEEFPHYRHEMTTFHNEIFRQQTERETKLGEQSFITDRGTADAFAFHPETMVLVNTTIEAEYRRYSSVVQLASAAALGEKYYCGDKIRLEPIDEALAIEEAIKKVWQNHPDYHFIHADRDFEIKFRRLTEVLDTCIKQSSIATE